ncbi:MAG: potassium channel family protein [Acidimicrobiia bacterium]
MTTETQGTDRRLDRYLTLLGLIIITLVLLMLVDFDELESLRRDVALIGVTLLSAGMLVAALWTSGAKPRSVRLAMILGGLAVVTGAIAAVTDTAYDPPILWVLLLAIAPVMIVRRIFAHDVVTNESILGAIAAFLLIALAFSFFYLLMDSPGSSLFGSREPSTAFPYFSLVTITTLGYGDLAPVSEPGRALATIEAVIGQIFLVVIIARIVSQYAGGWRRARPTGDTS